MMIHVSGYFTYLIMTYTECTSMGDVVNALQQMTETKLMLSSHPHRGFIHL